QKTRGGVLVGGISIPLRYMHSPVETGDLRDFAATAALLRAAAAEAELPHR
ncbi:MAG: M42 family peptidase, partial [Firmicutes bacterium]|nr:M42 family peptidase [Bacillota bacterium]